MKVGRLTNHLCYLCGPIDRVSDKGDGWRDDITPFLQSLGIAVLNPRRKPIDLGLEDREHIEKRKQLKAAGKFDQLADEVRQIRVTDLRMIDLSSFLIVYYDLNTIMVGTNEELFWGNREKKPIILMCPQGKKEIPDWLFGVCNHELSFETWEQVREYIRHIHLDELKDSDNLKRWMFFNFQHIYNHNTEEEILW